MSLTSIDLGLREMLRDPQRRQEFFKAVTQDEIASQIRALRKKRELNQTEFAHAADMKQSAVSRIEQAEYSSWTLTTLFRVAAALNARWRIILQPAEDAIAELEQMEGTAATTFEGQAAKDCLEESTTSDRKDAERLSQRPGRPPLPPASTERADERPRH